MEISSFLVSLQRLAARAVVNDFLVSNVFGPNPNDPQQTYSGHLGYAVTLVGEFEKLVQSGAIKPLATLNTSPSEITPSSFIGTNNASENEEMDISSENSLALRLVASDIGNYAILSSALPPLIVSAASENLSFTHPEFETGHDIPTIFKKCMVSPIGGRLVSADSGSTAAASATDSTPPLVATTTFDESSAVEAAKFLFHCTAVFYGFFNEELPPMPLEVFTRVFIATLKTVANNNKNVAEGTAPLIAGGTANSMTTKTTTAVAVVPEKKTTNTPSTSSAATLSFQAQLSSFLKIAQIQLQKASDNAQGEEDPDIEIRFFHLAAIVDLILRHFPSDLYISNCCVPIGDTAIQRSGDAELIRIIGGSRRRRRRTARQRNANDNKTTSSDKNNGEGDDNPNISGGGPLIVASARAKTAREIFAEEQARKAGVHIEEDNENGEDDHLIGPLGRPKRQATYDEARTEAFEIEVNDTIPSFLKDVARKTYINYRRAPINLAEKRELEAQMAARKAVVAAAREGALSSSAAAAAKAATLLSIAETQEKKNMERRRIRAIERKRQEAEAAAAAATYKSQSFEDEEGGGNEYERAGRIVVQEVAGDGKVGQKVIFEPKLTEGELDLNDLEVGGGVRSERDINSLPPWLRAAATGSDGRVHFGYQTNKSMDEQRKSLPVYKSREKIVEYVKNHSVTILQGETGSGKTTQIPQYLCDAGLTKRDPSDPYFTNNNSGGGYGGMRQREELMIGITQPRRVAAIELAKRVAKERGTRCGDEVGYTVRFDDQTSDRTKIKYMTDGMLLREALIDDTFSRYSIIVLDEAHERSINTDVLFGVLKKAVAKRPSLKLVITSATIELDRFCQYFGVSERFEIEGRTYPVDIKYLDTTCDDYVEKAVNTALTIHLTDKDLKGDILIFLTGEDEINSAIDRIQSRFTSLRDKAKRDLPPERHPFDLLVLPCYATVPNEAMSKVFDKTPARTRKIVISTNVAETSITIDGLAFVIDSGFCKQHVYDPRNKVEELKIVPVSQAQATQRTGRAGRTNPGTCYRLFTQDQFESEMLPATVPEIQRTNLINIVLTLKAVGFDDLLEFDFLDPPPKETLVNALQTLRYLGALDDDGLLTPIGERMSALPLPPAESKTLLASIDFGCAPTVMTIVSMMGQRKVFFTPGDRREEADFAHRQLKHPDGDQLTLANVYNSWVESGMSEKWCKANFVNPRAVTEARRAREQLQQMLSQRHDITKDARDSVAIRKALTSGYFFQAAKRGENNMYVTMADRRAVAMHPTSALFEQTPQYVVYHQLALKKKEYMMEVMRIEPQWLVELAPAYYAKPRAGELTKEQKAMRVDPVLRPWDSKNSWRISKVRKQKQ